MSRSQFIQFNPSGWMDRNDVFYLEKSHTGWLRLFGYTDEGSKVEVTFASEIEPWDSKSTCTFYPDPDGSTKLIGLYITLPPDRFNQLHSTLVRNLNSLEKIEVLVSIKHDRDNDYEVIGVQFDTSIGKYFD